MVFRSAEERTRRLGLLLGVLPALVGQVRREGAARLVRAGRGGLLVFVYLKALQAQRLAALLLADYEEVRSVLQVEGGTVPRLLELSLRKLLEHLKAVLLEVDEHYAIGFDAAELERLSLVVVLRNLHLWRLRVRGVNRESRPLHRRRPHQLHCIPSSPLNLRLNLSILQIDHVVVA